ncbi:MAG: nucleotidyl transferase AbiEii/AbiGii toxin family protein [Methylocystis sp.]|nr:nucleotidyl transferase AbiEii/AbiGii toxin family protein [Methylocystis sp.]
MTDFEGLLRRLGAEDVRFVLVGGFASTVHGSPRITVDLDIVYARDAENLTRLVRALAPLSPYLRGAPAGLPFELDVPTLTRGLNFTLTTTMGDLDLLGEVAGGGTYEQLLPQTSRIRVFDADIDIVTLSQLIRLKRAAGRPKDLEVLAELEALLEEQRSEK